MRFSIIRVHRLFFHLGSSETEALSLYIHYLLDIWNGSSKYIFQNSMPARKLDKWKILLSEFDIAYVIQKDVKKSTSRSFG